MTRKTATAVKEAQPDLLGGIAQPAKAKPIVTVEVKPKTTKKTQEISVHKPARKVMSGSPAEMLQVIAEAAANPKVDAKKMATLLDVQERIAREQARRAFTAAKLQMRPHLPIINKDGKIEIAEKPGKRGHTTPYATFEAIMEQIDSPLTHHGFDLFFTTDPTPNGDRLVVIGHLAHVDGHTETTRFPLPNEGSGSKNVVQGWMSTFSYGKRGVTIALLNIRTRAPEDRDRDGRTAPLDLKAGEVRTIEADDGFIDQGPARISEDQAMKLREAIEGCGIGNGRFCNFYKIDKVTDLPASRYKEALKACEDYKNRGTR